MRDRTDLIGNVAVQGDAVGTDDDGVDASGQDETRPSAVNDDPVRHTHPAKLPGRQARALEKRPRLANEDLGDTSSLVENADDRERGPPLSARQRTSVAVSQDPSPPFENCRPALADRAVRADVFLEHPGGFGDHRLAAARGKRRDAFRAPAEIHRCRAGLDETLRGILGGLGHVHVFFLGTACGEGNAQSASHPESHRSANRQSADRVDELVDRAQVEDTLLCRKRRLVDDDNLVGAPIDRPHRQNIARLSGSLTGAFFG